MAKIYANIEELIGRTPLVRLNEVGGELAGEILMKLESFNPFHSVKDRLGFALIDEAEKAGLISPQRSTIIEATSGNTGIGLAFVGKRRGYKVIFTMPENMSVERRKLLEGLGATCILTEASKGMKGAIDKAEELLKEVENGWMPRQFDNPANPNFHYRTTGPEIWEDTEGKVDIFVSGIGTGGTLTGTGRYLKEKNPNLKIVGVEPKDSPVLSGGKAGPHKIQGIGAGFIPKILDTSLIDEIYTATTEESITRARELAQKEGIFVGLSSGAAMAAALNVAQRTENKGKIIVVILPDFAERYLSSILFN